MEIKLVAIDLDGTLLNSDSRISTETKRMIKKVREKGIEVTLATGRMFASAYPYAEELNLNLPLITYQGALVKISETGEILYERNVPSELAGRVANMAKEYDYPINFYMSDYVVVEKMTPQTKHYSEKFNVRVKEVGDLSKVDGVDPIKLLVINENEEELKVFEDACRQKFEPSLYITKSLPEYLEFMHPEATKKHGLKAVTQHLGISRDQVMAIGDSYNDLEMLEFAGKAVVMGNAHEDIKEAADYVTKSNEDEGVAEALEKVILKREVEV